MFNRWIHICQAMDFNNYQITTVVNGDIGKTGKTNFTKQFAEYGIKIPLQRNETLKDKFAIGVSADWWGNDHGHLPLNERGSKWRGK